MPETPNFEAFRRWHVERVCPHCGGALLFAFSSVDDWGDINLIILSPPSQPQSWTCPHCRVVTTESFDGWLGPVKKRRRVTPKRATNHE